MKYKSVKGMEDILPGDARIWRWIEETARRVLESYGYAEIRTPILEDTSIFIRSIGETTDIVTKEMYTFKDRKDRFLSLRPEGTAPIVRAYIEHSLDKNSGELKLYYIGPMFRSERPQKGRSRQFHQIGVEVFGSSSPYADSEVIIQASSMLKNLGVADFNIKLNSLGCRDDKDKFAKVLKGYLNDKKNRLCKDCKERLKKNVLRVLDCKNDSCIQVGRNAPNILDSLCEPCRKHFDRVKEILNKVKVKYDEARNLIRGLDYYTGTVFEITHPALGGQDAIGAGGRYDNLVKDFGGPSIGAIGYALGIERIIIALDKKGLAGDKNIIYVATIGDEPKIQGIDIAEKLRGDPDLDGFVVLTDTKEASLKSQMRSADKLGARLVLIIGDDELSKGEAILRDMRTKEQFSVKFEDVVEKIKEKMK